MVGGLKKLKILLFVILLFLIFALLNFIGIDTIFPNSDQTDIPDPSAVYCQGLGYQYKIVTNDEGGQIGVCELPDGTECDSWDFFKGMCGKEYTYSIIVSDQDDDTLYVQWDWGDGSTCDWLGPFYSGTEVSNSHTWATKGTYTISVTVEDEHGLSVTASKVVSMPRLRTFNTFFHWLFDRFPKAFPLLRYIFNS